MSRIMLKALKATGQTLLQDADGVWSLPALDEIAARRRNEEKVT